MRKIRISDITMKNAGVSGEYSLTFREKIELAKLLDKAGISVIEAEPIVNVKIDSLLIKSIASSVKDSVFAVPVSFMEENSIENTWAALKEARKPRLQVVAPVSTVQMEYFCHKKPEALKAAVGEAVSKCRALCENVEFVAEDAGRSDIEFLKEVIAVAVEAGAGIVTVCDTAGTMMPDEFYAAVSAIKSCVPENVCLGVRCANNLFMADSCAVSAVRAGADEVKVAACGSSTTSLDKFAQIIAQRGDAFGVNCDVKTTSLQRTVSQIKWMCETDRSTNSPFDNGVRENVATIELTANDDMPTVIKAAQKLGYDLSEEDTAKVYEAFSRIAAKKTVGAKELDAIVASAALQVPPTYRVESYVINSGNVITATAHMKIKKGDDMLESVCVGDGPVDAAFVAIEKCIGKHYELDDFQIQAVTEGREAMGETVVRLRSEGKIYSGRGISTDIIGSSISAYINALNKIVYEEAEV